MNFVHIANYSRAYLKLNNLIFRSGKIICTGARNEHDSYIAARKIARIIQKLGFPVSNTYLL